MCNLNFPGVDAEFARLTARTALISRNQTFTIEGDNDRKLSRTATSAAKCSALQNAKRLLAATNYYAAELLRIS